MGFVTKYDEEVFHLLFVSEQRYNFCLIASENILNYWLLIFPCPLDIEYQTVDILVQLPTDSHQNLTLLELPTYLATVESANSI